MPISLRKSRRWLWSKLSQPGIFARWRGRPSPPDDTSPTAPSGRPASKASPFQEKELDWRPVVDQLPRFTRQVFILWQVERMDDGAIARQLGSSCRAVRRAKIRAVRHIARAGRVARAQRRGL